MEEKLFSILETVCDDDIFRENLDLDLFEEGLLDSLAIAELLIAIEDHFGITISPTEFDKQEFSTVHKIERILAQKGVN